MLTPSNFLCSGVVVGSAGRVIQPVPPGDTVSMRRAWHMAYGIYPSFTLGILVCYVVLECDSRTLV